MSLDLEVVLRDEDRNDEVGSTRCYKSLEKDSILLPKKWEPDVWR